MSALSRALVAAAVAVSPAEHRPVRREQWDADLLDATEVGLSPTAVAVGALTTALFHRRGPRRTTWGDAMTTVPSATTSAHTVRTVPVLVTVAVFAILMVGPWLILQPNYGYESDLDRIIGRAGTGLALDLVPGGTVVAAILLLPGTSASRRRVGATLVAVAAIGSFVEPFTTPSSWWPPTVSVALPLVLALAGWLVAAEARHAAWLLVLLPIGLAFLVLSGALWPLVPVRFVPCLLALPTLTVVAAGLIAWPTSSLRRRTRDQDHAATLVDKTV